MAIRRKFTIQGLEAEGCFIDEVISGEVEIENGEITEIAAKFGDLKPIFLGPDEQRLEERCLWAILHGWAKERFSEELNHPEPLGFFERQGWY